MKSKQREDQGRQPKGPLVVDVRVLFAVISFEPGLCCCLPSDSSHSVDILLLFVRRKVVHFPRIKSAFTRMCQDVFGAYLQLLSGSESRACAQEQRGEKAALCPKRFIAKARERGSKAVSAHANTHQCTNHNERVFFPPSAALSERNKWSPPCMRTSMLYAHYMGSVALFVCVKGCRSLRFVKEVLMKACKVGIRVQIKGKQPTL